MSIPSMVGRKCADAAIIRANLTSVAATYAPSR